MSVMGHEVRLLLDSNGKSAIAILFTLVTMTPSVRIIAGNLKLLDMNSPIP